MKPHYADDDVTLYAGDCIEVMRGLPDNSVDAVVTDPPYLLRFMGREWDSADGIAGKPEVWRECLRVLKPGGHLVAFGAPRTFHRMTVAIEDAGAEIRDCCMFMYGSGFPKSLDVSKAIDKAAGAEREVVGSRVTNVGMQGGNFANGGTTGEVSITAPATPAAQQWQGWGTALKPAYEPIVLARKPLAGTVAGNVLAWGTGALNIDGCRVGTETTQINTYADRHAFGDSQVGKAYESRQVTGRWPANVLLDEAAAAMLDAQSGESVSSDSLRINNGTHSVAMENPHRRHVVRGHSDRGGASRFFYTAKAGRDERPNVDGIAHPTVKPLDLMRWLVRLTCPPGGVVLEPFAGSGTTAEACVVEGFRCIAIEREADYLPLIVQRLTKPIERTLL